MTEPDTPTNPETPRRRRVQFGVGSLLMVMLVCSVTAAAGSYFVRSLQKPGGANRLIFILFTLVAPIVLMIVVSLVRQITLWLSRRR
jgi:magnesium-transporting ATPase (P-type)